MATDTNLRAIHHGDTCEAEWHVGGDIVECGDQADEQSHDGRIRCTPCAQNFAQHGHDETVEE